MAEDLRHRYAEALAATCRLHETVGGCDRCERRLAAVMAVRDEELEQLRYERRLLGAARMVLDLVAAGDASRWGQARREAGDLAQRIVDEIGHPVTDEPALGPEWRERAETAEAGNTLTRERLDALIAAGFGATTDTLRKLRASLDRG